VFGKFASQLVTLSTHHTDYSLRSWLCIFHRMAGWLCTFCCGLCIVLYARHQRPMWGRYSLHWFWLIST